MSAPDAADEGEQVARMARAGGLSLLGGAASAVAGVAFTAVITNGFDQGTAGVIFACTAAFLIASAVVQLGTEVGLVKSLPTLLVRGLGRRVTGVLLVAVLPVVAAAVCVAALGVALSDDVAALLAPGADPDVVVPVIRVLAVSLPFAATYQVVLAATRGLRTMVPTVTVDSLGRSAVQLVAVLGTQVLGLGAVAAVVAWSLPYGVALVAALVWLGALVKRAARASPAPPARRGPRPELADFWRFTGPRAIATTSQVVLKRVDIVLVAALRSPAEAALYAAATRFVALGQVGVQAMQQALSPQLSSLFAREDRAGARAVYRATTAWSMLAAWPLYLSCAVLAPDLLRIFGDGYAQVAPVVVILCLAMLLATASGAVDAVLLMSGRTWASLANNVTALVLNLALNVVLIPRYGALGASIAWAVAIVVRNVLPLVQVGLQYRISPLGTETVAVAVASVACFGAVPALLRVADMPSAAVGASLAVGAVVYVALAWRFRRLLRLDAFAGALRRGRRGSRGGRGRRGSRA